MNFRRHQPIGGTQVIKLLSIITLALVACSVNASETDNYALLAKKGVPEVTVHYRLADLKADRSEVEFAFKDVQAAFVKDGWLVVGNNWTQVPESTNQIRRESDRTMLCDVDVIGMPGTVHIQMKCGPSNQYGNGIFAHAEINPVTSGNWRKDINKVPIIVRQLHTHYAKLNASGLARFVPTW